MRALMIALLSVTSNCLHIQEHEGGRRVKRQDGEGFKEGCTTTGYEKRYRELCEEEFEEVCKTVVGVEYRKEIITRCDTRLEQQCNTTVRAVPREVCVQRNRTQCFHDYKIVPETTFTSECENIVQHICEEHYNVPVPVPHPVPEHTHVPFGPAPAPSPNTRMVNGRRRRKRQTTTVESSGVLSDLLHALNIPPSSLNIPPSALVNHQEIPAPPGCRSLVTQKCRKVPRNIMKKIPSEKCQEVPGVNCFLELVDIEEPNCYSVPVEDCQDELRETPFLTEEEECEDVPKIVCVEIEEEVPIQVCRTIDVGRTPIITSHGRTREVNDVKGLGVRAKVVGRIPQVGGVGGGRKGRSEGSGEGRQGRVLEDQLQLQPGELENLRSQIFDTPVEENRNRPKQRNRNAKSLRDESRNVRMRNILKKFLSERLI